MSAQRTSHGPSAGKRLRAGKHPQHGRPTSKPQPPDMLTARWLTDREESLFQSVAVANTAGCDLASSTGPAAPALPDHCTDDALEEYGHEEEDPFGWGCELG
eukprot:TRINITY_DN117988_c0_g1_i1.p1 TRINITY_DN117988_c0_g1~~TRINITY_DN117988_c0_g1_i1.p1  ORF type:complete len:113 (+),score=1.64 TRINITY_DN117988_c0_g1_i1:34-339(+)